jgi:hypothetical protein
MVERRKLLLPNAHLMNSVLPMLPYAGWLSA